MSARKVGFERLWPERDLTSSKRRVDPTTGSFEPGVRSSAVERRANDRKPAFAPRPGVGERRSRLAIARSSRSHCHDRTHPPSSHSIDRVQTFALKQYIED